MKTRRARVANQIKHMLEALEEDLIVEDTIDEELPDEELAEEDEVVEDDLELEIEEAMYALEADDDEDEDDMFEDEMEDDDMEEACYASEVEPGVEDTITDTGTGGDPTVKEITDKGEDAADEVEEDSEVFPTNSEYVATIVNKLDKVASALEENGSKKLAYRIDVIADAIENKYLK